MVPFEMREKKKKKKTQETPNPNATIMVQFGLRLFLCLCLCFLFFIFFNQKHMNTAASGSRALCTGPTPLSTSTHCPAMALSVGPLYCLQDPQISLFNNFFIKNGSHNTIHTFKNYFAIIFSVFSFNNNKFNPNEPNIYYHRIIY